MMDYFYTYKKTYFIPTVESMMDNFMKTYDFVNIRNPDDWSVKYERDDIVIRFDYWPESSPNFTLYRKIYIKKANVLGGIAFDFVMNDEDYENYDHSFTNEEELKKALKYAKIEVVKYAKPLWENREILETKIKEYHEMVEKQQIEGRNDHTRSRLDKAWKVRDYQGVIELIESINGELLKSEVMKLEYSKKHLNDQKPQRDETKQQNKPRL